MKELYISPEAELLRFAAAEGIADLSATGDGFIDLDLNLGGGSGPND